MCWSLPLPPHTACAPRCCRLCKVDTTPKPRSWNASGRSACQADDATVPLQLAVAVALRCGWLQFTLYGISVVTSTSHCTPVSQSEAVSHSVTVCRAVPVFTFQRMCFRHAALCMAAPRQRAHARSRPLIHDPPIHCLTLEVPAFAFRHLIARKRLRLGSFKARQTTAGHRETSVALRAHATESHVEAGSAAAGPGGNGACCVGELCRALGLPQAPPLCLGKVCCSTASRRTFNIWPALRMSVMPV
jgi:hypothetical protein